MDILLRNKIERTDALASSKPALTPAQDVDAHSAGNYKIPYAWQMMQNPTGTVCVCGANACMAGCCCLFTVPAGVTQLQFQIWGGGGNGTGCCAGACCRVGMSGATGEYKYMWISGVAAGDQFTLCAGGAFCSGACYNYCDCNGCTSFICGAKNTCILACGGTTGYELTCNGVSANLHRTNSNNWWWIGNNESNMCNESFCYGVAQNMSAACTRGCASTSASVLSYTEIPSHMGTWRKCDGNSYSSVCNVMGPVVQENGYQVCMQFAGWCGFNFGSCWNTCVSHNYPGMAGVGMNFSCNYSSTTATGARGRSGAIIVKYC